MKKKHKGMVYSAILIAVLALVHLFIQNINIALQYEYAKNKEAYQKIYSQNRSLSAQVSAKSSLERIEKTAREKLGMVYPEEIKYVIASGEAKS